MKRPVSGTMFALKEDSNASGLRDNHGWLYKYLYYNFALDGGMLRSVATGSEVFISAEAFYIRLEEMPRAEKL